jgi:hypothetical protein
MMSNIYSRKAIDRGRSVTPASSHTSLFQALLVSASLIACHASEAQTVAKDESCNLQPDPKAIQYIVGYGSLMQDESRRRTAPESGPAYPVKVTGWRRGWFARGTSVGFDATYLGIANDSDGEFNAVIYQIKDKAELTATDQRESFYCRRQLRETDYLLLTDAAPTPRGQVWIYVNSATTTATPDYPITQSYVDVFLSGCLEQGQRFQLADFAKQCINSTRDWSTFWVNDRIYPRRPFLFQPKAWQIDRLLHEEIPQYFKEIRIDSGTNH